MVNVPTATVVTASHRALPVAESTVMVMPLRLAPHRRREQSRRPEAWLSQAKRSAEDGMEFRELECFVVLSEELHFARTAERLYLSRSEERRVGKECGCRV